MSCRILRAYRKYHRKSKTSKHYQGHCEIRAAPHGCIATLGSHSLFAGAAALKRKNYYLSAAQKSRDYRTKGDQLSTNPQLSPISYLSRRSPATAGRRRINSQLLAKDCLSHSTHFLELRVEHIHLTSCNRRESFSKRQVIAKLERAEHVGIIIGPGCAGDSRARRPPLRFVQQSAQILRPARHDHSVR